MTYYNFTCTGGGTGQIRFTGSNSFNNITINPPKAFRLTAATTTTITGTLSLPGTVTDVITLASVTAANHTLTSTSGTHTAAWTTITNSQAGGGATWTATDNCTDGGNNTGWSFTAAGGKEFIMVN